MLRERKARLATCSLMLASMVGCASGTSGASIRTPPPSLSSTVPASAVASPQGRPVTTWAPTVSPTVSAAPATPLTPPPPLHVVGLGDSVMSGEACGCDGIPAAYGRLLAAHHPGRPVDVGNLGTAGATSQQLADALTYDGGTRAAVASADVVLVIVGANDIEGQFDPADSATCGEACWTPAVADVRGRVSQVLASARSLRAGRPTTFLVAGYWSVFLDGHVAAVEYGPEGQAWARTVTNATNGAIRDAALANQMTYVDLVGAFAGPTRTGDDSGLLAPDGDHPNTAGVDAIARALDAAPRP